MKLVFKFKAGKLPTDTSMFGLSLIKKAIEKVDEDYYKSVFFRNGKKTKALKPFVYTIYYTDYEFKDSFIQVNGDCYLEISCLDEDCLIRIFNGFTLIDQINLQGFKIKKTKLFIKEDTIVNSGKILVRTKSPILIKDVDGKSLKLLEDIGKYTREFNYIVNECFKIYRRAELLSPICINPVFVKNQVYKQRFLDEDTKDGERIIHYNVTKGLLELSGHPSDLNFLLKAGVGFKRSQGFGFIELVKEELLPNENIPGHMVI